MNKGELQEMDFALEEMLVCGNLDLEQQSLIERCLDQGYLMLNSTEKSMVRRLLNAQSSGSKTPGSAASPLQRWRQRRSQQLGASKGSNAKG
ncbi:MAG: hypothetical protein ACSHXK_14900 [Oceanococcus sp.]